jgi:hypothetical protein
MADSGYENRQRAGTPNRAPGGNLSFQAPSPPPRILQNTSRLVHSDGFIPIRPEPMPRGFHPVSKWVDGQLVSGMMADYTLPVESGYSRIYPTTDLQPQQNQFAPPPLQFQAQNQSPYQGVPSGCNMQISQGTGAGW